MESTSLEKQQIAGRALVWLMSGQSLFLVAISINRLTGVSDGYVSGNQFMRWRELFHLLLPLVSILLAIRMWRCLFSIRHQSRWWLEAVFFGAIYLSGVAYGLHELANYLGLRLRDSGIDDPSFREIIRFTDDDFSHWVFYVAFVGMNLPLSVWQRINPFDRGIPRPVWIGVVLNALLISCAMVFNLTRGDLGYDLWVVTGLTLCAILLQIRLPPQPIMIYQIIGFGLGAAGALVKRGLE